MPKKVQFTQERVEYNAILFDDPLKGSKSLKIFKINLTFHFDKLSHLSKSVHIGENSQILTVSNKKNHFFLRRVLDQLFKYNFAFCVFCVFNLQCEKSVFLRRVVHSQSTFQRQLRRQIKKKRPLWLTS
jgi:hypothetical protein